MARFVDVIDLPLPIDQAFDYLADFSNSAEWDPGVAEARQLDDAPVRLGTRFHVVVAFLGRRIPFDYEISIYERPQRLALRGRGGSVLSIDELTFCPREGGTRVTYEARLELAGVAQLADPLLHLLFQKLGAISARGLRETVARRVAA